MTETEFERDRALAAVDEALAGGRVTAEDPAARELQDLALALEAESELPRDEFARELEESVAAGFPRKRRLRAPRLPRPPRLPSLSRGRALALVGAAAALLLVAGVALYATRTQEITFSEGLSAAPRSPNAARDATGARALEQSAGAQPGAPARRIERSAELTLAAPGDRLESVADSIVRVTDRNRGFVLRSSVSSGADSARGGSFDLRVPADSLRAALGDLSRLGHVRSRRQAGQDITAAFVSTRDRLDTATAERRSLLRRLAHAGSDRAAERLRTRLDSVSVRIARMRHAIGRLRERTSYAAVSVDLEAEHGTGGAGPGATRRALDDSLGILSGSLNLAVRALGILVPLALLAGLGWAGATMLRRRRREAALR
jgi:hypothetical protein